MPNRFSILNDTNIDAIRQGYLKELNNHTKNDVILYAGSFLSVSNKKQVEASISVHDIQLFMAVLNNLKGKKLDLILHSPGGSIEATEQLVNYLREKYNTIRAIIPGNAMSAAQLC